jgi:formate dehydrogenase beta subunit
MRTPGAAFPLAGIGDRRGDRLHPRPRRRIRSAIAASTIDESACWREGYDACFVGTGAPRGRDLDMPGRKEAAAQHPCRDRLALERVLRPHHERRQARAGARRRQHRDGLLPHRAPFGRRRRQGDRAFRLRRDESQPPGKKKTRCTKASRFSISACPRSSSRQRPLDRHDLRKGARRVRRHRQAQLVPTGEPDEFFECDDVLIAVGQENAFPWIERDSASISTNGACRWSIRSRSSRPCRTCSSAATQRSARRISSGRWRTATPRRSDRQAVARRRHEERPAPGVTLMSQKMGIHEWSYDNAVSPDERYAVPWSEAAKKR